MGLERLSIRFKLEQYFDIRLPDDFIFARTVGDLESHVRRASSLVNGDEVVTDEPAPLLSVVCLVVADVCAVRPSDVTRHTDLHRDLDI